MDKVGQTAANDTLAFTDFYNSFTDADTPVIADVQRYLRGVRDQKLNLEELARRFALDKYQLIRHFKRQVGLTPNCYLTMLRIEQAMYLLAQGHALVEVALETGFYDQSHFARCFRTHTGITPRRYQKSCPTQQE
jgi:transcriptional regulator GlxA family with amidase domain